MGPPSHRVGFASGSEAYARELEALCCAALFGPGELSARAREACVRLEALGGVPRPVETEPVVSEAIEPLTAGEVEASFFLDTGGDQMRCRPVQGGLGVRVTVGTRQVSQRFASCDDAGFGSAIDRGDGTQSALCDTRELVLVRRGDAFVVLEGERVLVRLPIAFDQPSRSAASP